MADRQDVTFTVQMESKYPPKGGGHSYKCDIEGTECYLDTVEVLQLGQTYVAHSIANLERKGKSNTLYGKASGIAPVGGAAAPAPAAPRAPTGYPSRAYVALEKLLGKSVQGYAPEEDKLKAAVFGCMWITMSKDPVTMTEMAEEGAGGGASSSGPDDELPEDSTIPF